MNTGRILIVDDSDNIRNVLQMNFEWLGYQVSCAKDGEEALRRVSEDRPDIVILDVMMPRMNGYQVCRSIKSDPQLRKIPVVFLSAKDQQGDQFWGKDCGADEYLTKPFSAAKLERVIEKLLREGGEKGSAGVITEKMRALEAQGVACTVVRFTVDLKALQVFRQKYGEMRFQEALEGTESTIQVVLRAASPDCLVEDDGNGVYRAVLPLEAEETRALAQRVCMQAELLFRSMYSGEDADRGYIVTRSQEGEEIHVPLMTLGAAIPSAAPAS